MNHDDGLIRVTPPLRTFEVTIPVITDDGVRQVTRQVVAHLVFNNSDRGEGLVFRRYYDDNVRTEKVAEFLEWSNYMDITDWDTLNV